MYLKFYVNDQTLTLKNRTITASGSKNYLFAEFRFSAEWSGLEKTAVFVSADESSRYHMLLVGGRCAVPAELIKDGGFYVSVFGGNRITSTRVFVDVSQSGIEPGLTPPEPTEDIYDQIMDRISGFHDALKNISVENSMLQDGSVTAEKIADGVLFSKKYSDLTDIPSQFKPSAHSHSVKDITDLEEATTFSAGLMSAADKVLLDNLVNGGDIAIECDYLSDYQGTSSDLPEHWFDLPYELNEEFTVYIDIDDTHMHYLSTDKNVYSLNLNDEVGWILSHPIYKGKNYIMKITKQPVTGVDAENGKIEVVEYIAKTLEERITALEENVGDANSVLEAIISEGV